MSTVEHCRTITEETDIILTSKFINIFSHKHHETIQQYMWNG